MKNIVLVVVLFLSGLALAESGEVMFESRPGCTGLKKCLAFGWEFTGKTPAELLAMADALDATPIDGVGVSIQANPSVGRTYGRETRMTRTLWKREHMGDLVPAFRRLAAHKSFRHSFLMGLNVPPKERFDWRDDAAWAAVANNLSVVAWVAREAGFPGIHLDPEDYSGKRQFFRASGDPDEKTLRSLVRRRGREVFEAVFAAYPDITLFAFIGFSDLFFNASKNDVVAQLRDRGQLWNDFVVGIFDALPPTARFVDGMEDAYKYDALKRDFLVARTQLHNWYVPLMPPENRTKYRAQCQASFGLFLDMYVNSSDSSWYSPPVDGSRLKHLLLNAAQAIDAADEYVWFWGELGTWARPKGAPAGKHATWNEQLPGLNSSLAAVCDPRGFYLPRVRRAVAEGTLTNLVRTAACTSQDGFGTWQMPKTSQGTFFVDKTDGDGGCLAMRGVRRGCYTVTCKEVRPGDRILARFSVKGFEARGYIQFFREEKGQTVWLAPSEYVPTEGDDFTAWRRACRLVEAPAEATGVTLALNAERLGPDEVVRYDNVELYRLPSGFGLEK